MRRFVLFLVAAAALGACNSRRLHIEAPAISGAEWLQSPADVAPELDGRWILVEFFSPT
jgi:hypothetical protein